jgi:predicted TIM-barrel fold metal-dependent hydrolase
MFVLGSAKRCGDMQREDGIMITRRQVLGGLTAGAVGAVLGARITPSIADTASAPAATGGSGAPAIAFGQPADFSIVEDGVAPQGTIDWHNHWISDNVVKLLQQHDALSPQSSDSYSSAVSGSGLPSPKAPGSGSNFTIPIDRRIEHLDKTNVSRQVISWPTTLGWDAVLTPDEARTIWRTFNDDLADLVRRHPEHFSGYGIVPTSDIDWAVKEADRGFTDLGLIGVTLPVGSFQTLEGAQKLKPVVDVIQQHKGILYLHTGPAFHTIPGQRISDVHPDLSANALGRLAAPATFSHAAVTLSQTDYLDPYPDVAVQIAMLGGLTSFLFALSKINPVPAGSPDPVERLRRVYLDASTSRVTHTLELAVQTIGADRILFGTDYGAGNRLDPVVAAVNHASITSDQRQAIFVDNGLKLYAQKGAKA